MGEQDVLEARERDFKQFMKDKTTNTREKQENWYYVQQFDETCSMCEHGEDDPYLMHGESFQCPHCGVVAPNGWCKRFEMNKRSGVSVFMRPIKYRAFYKGEMRRVTALEWIHEGEDLAGCYLTGIDKCVIVNNDETSFGVDLLAFTGLHDRNGTEIYEGHILKCKFYSDVHEDENLVVRWNPYLTCFALFRNMKKIDNAWGTGNIGLDFKGNFKSLEVIGTVQENPGLLKGE